MSHSHAKLILVGYGNNEQVGTDWVYFLSNSHAWKFILGDVFMRGFRRCDVKV